MLSKTLLIALLMSTQAWANFILSSSKIAEVKLPSGIVLAKMSWEDYVNSTNTDPNFKLKVLGVEFLKDLRVADLSKIELSPIDPMKERQTLSLKYQGEKRFIQTQTLYRSTTYRVKEAIRAFHTLNISDVEKSVRYTSQKNPFIDVDTLAFYRTNKPLKQGQLLKASDLSKVVIIRPGQSVSVNIRGNGVAIRAKLRAMGQAKYGDTITLKNLQSGKIVTAKAMGVNRAIIDL